MEKDQVPVPFFFFLLIYTIQEIQVGAKTSKHIATVMKTVKYLLLDRL